MSHLRLLALAGFLLGLPVLSAQDLGQACLLAYVDWDENGARGLDEPSLSQGIGADLLNARGITVASRLLVDSPFADDGLLCFDQLAAGDYRLRLTSAAYAATTNINGSAAVVLGEPPPRVDIGVIPIFADSLVQARSLENTDGATVDLLLAAGAFATALLLAAATLALLATKSTRIPRLVFRGDREEK
ncbi:MAG: hypothetical protein OXE95_11585 [Chloroflexi bacterium]|nr:hypothetical protein [Chloroflexota bacterium]MCY4248200.1 hypothetical protein [Chloroflexota bacterium]